ncbi:hypothetical protein VNO80_07335 [Phaseolus coccineus]|uniref:Uncharacterized protein n=1 Tax=Phaseolus coccineus TaxID=3886 RepID=A0AAN9NJZ8_PHACN
MAKTRGSWLLKNRIPSRYRTPSHTLLPLTRYSLTHSHSPTLLLLLLLLLHLLLHLRFNHTFFFQITF